MKKIYEVPAMEVIRLDASENIAKLPTIDSGSTSTSVTDGKVVTTTRTTGLAAVLSGLTGSVIADA